MHQTGWLTGDIAGVAVEAVDGLRGAARNLKDFHSGVARRRQQLLVGGDFQLVYLPHRLSRASGDDNGQCWMPILGASGCGECRCPHGVDKGSRIAAGSAGQDGAHLGVCELERAVADAARRLPKPAARPVWLGVSAHILAGRARPMPDPSLTCAAAGKSVSHA